MNLNQVTNQKQFYLVTVDLIQGVCIFYFIIWHTLLWWDEMIDSKWPNVEFIVAVFMTTALVVPPFFFSLYAFNTVNSLLRKETIERSETRVRLLKKTVILFIIAEFSQGIVGVVVSPEYLLNFLLTWELFHMFALTTLFFLLVFEFAWKIEENSRWNYKRVIIAVLTFFLIFLISFFLIFHDFSVSRGIEEIYVNLDLNLILQRVVFEYGQNPIIPFFLFPIVGGLLASILDLPHEQKNIVSKKGKLVLTIGFIIFIIGIMFLGIERYVSTPLLYPASSSFVLITIGLIILITTIGILLLDINSLNSRQPVNKLILPIVLISKISLTVFIFHNIAYIIPPNLPLVQTLIPSETVVLIVAFIYSILFIPVAFFWQKWNYKYSIEWMISRLQRAQWRWWFNKIGKTDL